MDKPSLTQAIGMPMGRVMIAADNGFCGLSPLYEMIGLLRQASVAAARAKAIREATGQPAPEPPRKTATLIICACCGAHDVTLYKAGPDTYKCRKCKKEGGADG